MPVFITPRGARVRSQSQRRYVVVREVFDRQTQTASASVERRSDDVRIARKFVATKGASASPAAFVTRYVFDSTTQEQV